MHTTTFVSHGNEPISADLMPGTTSLALRGVRWLTEEQRLFVGAD